MCIQSLKFQVKIFITIFQIDQIKFERTRAKRLSYQMESNIVKDKQPTTSQQQNHSNQHNISTASSKTAAALMASGSIHHQQNQHNLFMNIRPVLSPHPREHPPTSATNNSIHSAQAQGAPSSAANSMASHHPATAKHRTAYKSQTNQHPQHQQISNCMTPNKAGPMSGNLIGQLASTSVGKSRMNSSNQKGNPTSSGSSNYRKSNTQMRKNEASNSLMAASLFKQSLNNIDKNTGKRISSTKQHQQETAGQAASRHTPNKRQTKHNFNSQAAVDNGAGNNLHQSSIEQMSGKQAFYSSEHASRTSNNMKANSAVQGDNQTLNTQNNVFERLYKKQLQNVRVQPSSTSNSAIITRSHSGLQSQQYQHHTADDSSGGMTANEFHQFLRDQKLKRNSQGNMQQFFNPATVNGGQASAPNLSPARKKRKDTQRNEISQTQDRRSNTRKKSINSSFMQRQSYLENFNSAQNLVQSAQKRQKKQQALILQNQPCDTSLNDQAIADDEDVIQDSLLNEENSVDLMVVNLTNTVTTMPQPTQKKPEEEEGTTDRRQYTQADHKIRTERQVLIGSVDNVTGFSHRSANNNNSVESASATRESHATCSAVKVSSSNFNFEEEKQSNGNEFEPTPGPTRYALRLNEVLVGNFVNQEEKQGAQSNRVYSKRGDVMKEEDLEGEYIQRGRVSQQELIDSSSVSPRRAKEKHLFATNSFIPKSSYESTSNKDKEFSMMSVSCDTTTPNRRSRSQRKSAYKNKSVQSSFQSSKDSQIASNTMERQQKLPSKLVVLDQRVDQSNMIGGSDEFTSEPQYDPVLASNQLSNTEGLTLVQAGPITSAVQIPEHNESDTNSKILPLSKVLEPVHEVADEEAANYFSNPKQQNHSSNEQDDILADVSMVDPQVQLFDDNTNDNGEDGGAAEESDDDNNSLQIMTNQVVEGQHRQQQEASNVDSQGPQVMKQSVEMEESKKPNPGPGQSIEQLYGQISMFDQITEENYYGRGEQSDASDEGEDATQNIKKFRQQIEHLNSDLHDLIYSGEDEGESGPEDDLDCVTQTRSTKMKKLIGFKKSGKPQNLDLLPSNYNDEVQEYEQQPMLNSDVISNNGCQPETSQQILPPMMPAHMIKEVVQVLDDDTYIVQDSIFNQRYQSEDDDLASDADSVESVEDADEDDKEGEDDADVDLDECTNEENEDRPEDEEEQAIMVPQGQQQMNAMAGINIGGEDEQEIEAIGEQVYDDSDLDSYSDEANQAIPMPGGADEMIQAMLNQEANMLGAPAPHDVPQEGGNFDHHIVNQNQPVAVIEPDEPCQDCITLQENQSNLQEQLAFAQNKLQMMEEKFLHLNDQMSKFQTTTNLLETELHKKDTIIENYDKEMELLKAQNEQMMNKLQTVQKIQKGRQSMQKDLLAYQKLVKDQSECIEALHSTKSEDKKVLRQLQRENQRLKDHQQVSKTASEKIPSRRLNNSAVEHASNMALRNTSSASSMMGVVGPSLSSYQQKTLNDSLMPDDSHNTSQSQSMMTMQHVSKPRKTAAALIAQTTPLLQQQQQKQALMMPANKNKRTQQTKFMQTPPPQQHASSTARQPSLNSLMQRSQLIHSENLPTESRRESDIQRPNISHAQSTQNKTTRLPGDNILS